MAQISIDKLSEMGSRWTKGSMDRIYLNNLSQLYGIATERYNTGRISSATLDGEPISNTKAFAILQQFQMGKFWYDVADGKFYGKGLDKDTLNRLAARAREQAQQ